LGSRIAGGKDRPTKKAARKRNDPYQEAQKPSQTGSHLPHPPSRRNCGKNVGKTSESVDRLDHETQRMGHERFIYENRPEGT